MNNNSKNMCARGCFSGEKSSLTRTSIQSKFIPEKIYTAVWNNIVLYMPSDGTVHYCNLCQVDRNNSKSRFRVTMFQGDIDAYIGICSEDPGFDFDQKDEYENLVMIVLKGIVWTCISMDKEWNIGDRLFLTSRNKIMNIKEIKKNCLHSTDVRELGTIIDADEDERIRLFV